MEGLDEMSFEELDSLIAATDESLEVARSAGASEIEAKFRRLTVAARGLRAAYGEFVEAMRDADASIPAEASA